jgi:hypothetical protein
MRAKIIEQLQHASLHEYTGRGSMEYKELETFFLQRIGLQLVARAGRAHQEIVVAAGAGAGSLSRLNKR